MHIWNIETGTLKELDSRFISKPGIRSVSISPDGRLVAAGCPSFHPKIYIWDVQSAILMEEIPVHGDSVRSVAFTPDGHGIISGSQDGTLRYWNVRAVVSRLNCAPGLPAIISSDVFTTNNGCINSVSVSQDGQ